MEVVDELLYIGTGGLGRRRIRVNRVSVVRTRDVRRGAIALLSLHQKT